MSGCELVSLEAREGVPIARHEITAGNGIEVVGDPFGAVNFAGDFDVLLIFPLDALVIVFPAQSFGGFVAEPLKIMNLAGDAAKDGDRLAAFLGIGSELLLGFRFEEVG